MQDSDNKKPTADERLNEVAKLFAIIVVAAVEELYEKRKKLKRTPGDKIK